MTWTLAVRRGDDASPRAIELPESTATASPVHEFDLRRILIDQLGIDPADVDHVPTPELARLTGAMLREATQGAMDLLRSRAVIRRDIRTAVTMIDQDNDNPLDVCPDARGALTQMLGARGRGHLAPEEVLRTAFLEIQAHELALIAGMRAVLDDVMARINPAAVERSLAAPTGLAVLVGNRRARSWRRFVEIWEQVSCDADDEFEWRFGKPLSRAYQALLDGLQSPKG